MNAPLRTVVLAAVLVYGQLLVQLVFRTLFLTLDGGELLGMYAQAEAVFGIVLVVGSMGLGVGLVRGTNDPDDYWPAAAAAVLYWCLLVCAGALYLVLSNSGEARIPIIIAAASNVVGFQVLAIWSYLGRVVAFNGVKLLASCVSTLTVVLASFGILTVPQFTGAFCLVALSAATVSVLLVPELTSRLRPSTLIRGTRILCGEVFPASRAFWASLIATVVYGRLDIVLLDLMNRPAAEIGQYAYVYGLFGAACILPATAQKCLERPLLSKEVDGRKFIHQWMRGYFAVGIIVAIVFGVGLPHILSQVIPLSDSARKIFFALTPAIVFVYVANPIGLVLMTNGQAKQRATIQWVGAGANFIGNLLVISKWGAVGAAWTTSASYAILYFGYLIACVRGREYRESRDRMELGLYGAASLLLFVILFTRR